jgi:hypothetical protein
MAETEYEKYEFPDEKEEKAEKSAKVQVEIEDDTPEEDRGRKTDLNNEDPTDDELSSYGKNVKNRIQRMTRNLNDERRAKEEALREREAAERFSRAVYEENKTLKSQLESGSKVFVEQNKTTAQIEMDVAKKKFKEAYEAGDSDGVATAQEEIARATLRMDKAANLRPIEHFEDAPPPPQRTQPQVNPKTQRWIQDNSEWFGKDEEMTMAAMGLDKKLQSKYGADYIGSDDYFQTIDGTMRKRFPEFFKSQSHEDEDDLLNTRSEPAEDTRRAKSTSVVAPATRSTPPNRIRLKASEVNIARRLGITPEQYAKQVALLGRNE